MPRHRIHRGTHRVTSGTHRAVPRANSRPRWRPLARHSRTRPTATDGEAEAPVAGHPQQTHPTALRRLAPASALPSHPRSHACCRSPHPPPAALPGQHDSVGTPSMLKSACPGLSSYRSRPLDPTLEISSAIAATPSQAPCMVCTRCENRTSTGSVLVRIVCLSVLSFLWTIQVLHLAAPAVRLRLFASARNPLRRPFAASSWLPQTSRALPHGLFTVLFVASFRPPAARTLVVPNPGRTPRLPAASETPLPIHPSAATIGHVVHQDRARLGCRPGRLLRLQAPRRLPTRDDRNPSSGPCGGEETQQHWRATRNGARGSRRHSPSTTRRAGVTDTAPAFPSTGFHHRRGLTARWRMDSDASTRRGRGHGRARSRRSLSCSTPRRRRAVDPPPATGETCTASPPAGSGPRPRRQRREAARRWSCTASSATARHLATHGR